MNKVNLGSNSDDCIVKMGLVISYIDISAAIYGVKFKIINLEYSLNKVVSYKQTNKQTNTQTNKLYLPDSIKRFKIMTHQALFVNLNI